MTTATPAPADLVEAFEALDDLDPRPVPGEGRLLVLGQRIGGGSWVFQAWEPDTADCRHGTIRRLPDGYYGTVASGPIPDLPTVAERYEALAALQRTSVLAVRAARPDVARLLDLGYGRIDGGTIRLAVLR